MKKAERSDAEERMDEGRIHEGKSSIGDSTTVLLHLSNALQALPNRGAQPALQWDVIPQSEGGKNGSATVGKMLTIVVGAVQETCAIEGLWCMVHNTFPKLKGHANQAMNNNIQVINSQD